MRHGLDLGAAGQSRSALLKYISGGMETSVSLALDVIDTKLIAPGLWSVAMLSNRSASNTTEISYYQHGRTRLEPSSLAISLDGNAVSIRLET
jgi:hypothetical protein